MKPGKLHLRHGGGRRAQAAASVCGLPGNPLAALLRWVRTGSLTRPGLPERAAAAAGRIPAGVSSGDRVLGTAAVSTGVAGIAGGQYRHAGRSRPLSMRSANALLELPQGDGKLKSALR